MRRTYKILAVMALALPALYFGSATNAAAFCVYNHTNIEIRAVQTAGGTEDGDFASGSFAAKIKPGKKACCNWKTKDCNRKGRRDSPVEFRVEHPGSDAGVPGLNLCGDNWVKVKAGGWLTVSGKDPHLKCKAHYDK